MSNLILAVNGTLMRGLELNPNLIEVGATFVAEATTAPCYRLWTIHDRHPAMMRFKQGGASVQLELWSVPPAGLGSILSREPAGLAIGKEGFCVVGGHVVAAGCRQGCLA